MSKHFGITSISMAIVMIVVGLLGCSQVVGGERLGADSLDGALQTNIERPVCCMPTVITGDRNLQGDLLSLSAGNVLKDILVGLDVPADYSNRIDSGKALLDAKLLEGRLITGRYNAQLLLDGDTLGDILL